MLALVATQRSDTPKAEKEARGTAYAGTSTTAKPSCEGLSNA